MFLRTFVNASYRSSCKSNITVPKITCHRSLHLASRYLSRDFIVRTGKCHHSRIPVLSATFIRHISASTSEAENASSNIASESTISQVTDTLKIDDVISKIPDVPTPIQPDVLEVLRAEPTLQSLGLGSYSPAGLIQQYLDFLHVTFGMPWWATIVATTVCVRILILPITIRLQRTTSLMHNLQPQIQHIQDQLTEARKMGDRLEVVRLSQELHMFMKEKGVNPLSNLGLPMIQAPIFLSFFWALRGMVNAPVESMKTGGLWWFEDLTVSDPYYLLPLLTCSTVALTFEMGADSQKLQTLGMMKYVFRTAPVIMFPFIINFEGAILCYWVSANLFSLLQVIILRTPKVRKYFNIPEQIKHDMKKLPVSKKKFTEGFKDSWTNMKVARELRDRELYDAVVFEKAGKGPIPKTYKFDPTKPVHKRRD